MLRKVLLLILVFTAVLPALATAQQVEITPFIGYRFGGELGSA